jgi:hypothetical protein
VTDQKKVSNFMKMLFSTGGFSDLKVLNYHKDNTLLQNSIRCFPVIDNCGPDFSAQVSHIAAVLVHTKGDPHNLVASIEKPPIYPPNKMTVRIHPVGGRHGPHGGLASEGSRHAHRQARGLSHLPTLQLPPTTEVCEKEKHFIYFI